MDRFAAAAARPSADRDGQRVSNDVEVGPAGTFLLVTGSNMSGKSTLLRAIGVNAVLAQAGGPVCAAALRLPPVTLATSILVEDSLADGVSFFMAELRRIQKIVAAAGPRARRGAASSSICSTRCCAAPTATSARWRCGGSSSICCAQGAIGAVSTHDLQLAEVGELQGCSSSPSTSARRSTPAAIRR